MFDEFQRTKLGRLARRSFYTASGVLSSAVIVAVSVGLTPASVSAQSRKEAPRMNAHAGIPLEVCVVNSRGEAPRSPEECNRQLQDWNKAVNTDEYSLRAQYIKKKMDQRVYADRPVAQQQELINNILNTQINRFIASDFSFRRDLMQLPEDVRLLIAQTIFLSGKPDGMDLMNVTTTQSRNMVNAQRRNLAELAGAYSLPGLLQSLSEPGIGSVAATPAPSQPQNPVMPFQSTKIAPEELSARVRGVMTPEGLQDFYRATNLILTIRMEQAKKTPEEIASKDARRAFSYEWLKEKYPTEWVEMAQKPENTPARAFLLVHGIAQDFSVAQELSRRDSLLYRMAATLDMGMGDCVPSIGTNVNRPEENGPDF